MGCVHLSIVGLVWSVQRCLCEVSQLGKIGMEAETDGEIEAAVLGVDLA
jgi:hypothetical protein